MAHLIDDDSWFTYLKWWFSIATLNYQRVHQPMAFSSKANNHWVCACVRVCVWKRCAPNRGSLLRMAWPSPFLVPCDSGNWMKLINPHHWTSHDISWYLNYQLLVLYIPWVVLSSWCLVFGGSPCLVDPVKIVKQPHLLDLHQVYV